MVCFGQTGWPLDQSPSDLDQTKCHLDQSQSDLNQNSILPPQKNGMRLRITQLHAVFSVLICFLLYLLPQLSHLHHLQQLAVRPS